MGVFTKESLLQFMAGAGCFSVIQMLLLVILGGLLVANEHYHQLLSNEIKHCGGGLIFTGFLYVFPAGLGFYSARTQNKFLMLLNFAFLSLLIFLQMLFSSVALGRTVPSYSNDVQVACLTVGEYERMSPSNRLQCEQFFRSDNFAGISLVWQSYYSKAVTDGSYRAMVLTLQKDNFCCGNALPLHCVNDTRSFPSRYPNPVIRTQRRQCESRGSSAYLSTKDCRVNDKCDYDLPNGLCGNNPVTTTTRGCGSFVFQSISSQISAIATTALIFVLFPIGFLIGTVCLCFKRRDEDVLPNVEYMSKVKVHAGD